MKKRIIAGLMACLMVLAVIITIPVMNTTPVSEPDTNSTYMTPDLKNMIRDAFCQPYGIQINFGTPSRAGVDYDANGKLVVLGLDEIRDKDERLLEMALGYRIEPDYSEKYGTPCEDLFETDGWAWVKEYIESEADFFNVPYRVVVGTSNDMKNGMYYDEIIIWPDSERKATRQASGWSVEKHVAAYWADKNGETTEPTPEPTPTPIIDQPKPVDNAATLAPKIQVDNKPMSVQHSIMTVTINGVPTELDAIVLTEAGGGAHTYYKLRDVGEKVGFNVDWTPETGITVSTD